MTDFATIQEIRARCDGMLRADVYLAIHEAALRCPDGAFVEIGTAHAAGTVCLALGMASGHSFDRFARGSRSRYKGDNKAIACANLAHYGVDDRVTIHPGDVADTLPLLDCGEIDLLFLDCDGRIDRDLQILGDQLKPGAAVIIDDCADRVRVKDRGNGAARIDMKHRATWLLTQTLADGGFLIFERMVNQTWFGTWAGKPVADWSADSIIGAYRQLVFSDGEVSR